MARDYSKYDPRVDNSIVRNFRDLALKTIGLSLHNVSDEEIYITQHVWAGCSTHEEQEYNFLLDMAEEYGDENHPWFEENKPKE